MFHTRAAVSRSVRELWRSTRRWRIPRSQAFFSGTQYYDDVMAERGTAEESPEFWRDVSSLTFVARAKAPLLVVHGTADLAVPHEWSAELVDKWTAAGREAKFLPVRVSIDQGAVRLLRCGRLLPG